MANISSINGNPIVPSNGSVGTAQVASGYSLMSAADKAKLDGIYDELKDKPKINGVEVSGSKSLDDYGIASIDMIGSVAERKSYIDVGTLSYGIVEGNVGSTATIGTQSTWKYAKVAVTPGARYEVSHFLLANTSVKATLVYVDSSDVILKAEAPGVSTAGDYMHVTIAPANAAYMYVMNGYGHDSDIIITLVNGYDSLKYQFDTANDIADSKFGDVPITGDEVQLGTISNGSLSGNIGSVIAFGNQGYWRRAAVNVNAGERYRVAFKQSGNSTVSGYIWFVNSSNIIIDIEGKPADTSAAIKNVDVTVPYDASKMYIMSYFLGALYMSVIHITGYNSLQNQIDSIKKRLHDDNLPYYYTSDWIDNHISAIRKQAKVMNGVSFAFITDLHLAHNSQNSKYLLKEILDSTSVPFVICGGDYPVAYGDETMVREAGSKLLDYQSYIGKDRFFSIRGNHDFTAKTSADADTGLTLPVADAYDYICRAEEWHVGGMLPNHMCFWLDNAAQKTRIICLNSCDGQSEDSAQPWGVYCIISQEQVDWLVNEALDISGYHVIFVSHVPADPKLSSYLNTQDVLHGIMKALKKKTTYSASGSINVSVDYSNTDLDVICHISGHNHKDESNSDEGLISITAACDAHYGDDSIARTVGTVSEQAFDVFTIDFDRKKISAHRVGAGSDRNWVY